MTQGQKKGPARKGSSADRPSFGVIGVGVLLLLVAAWMLWMRDGQTNPATVMLVAVCGAGCIYWGFRRSD